MDAGFDRWGLGWDIAWRMEHSRCLEMQMSNDAPVTIRQIKHLMPRLPEAHGPCELSITDEDGNHFFFSLRRSQMLPFISKLMEVKSRMSEGGKAAE